jgi:transcriptional regulator with XRE-family HTH domain
MSSTKLNLAQRLAHNLKRLREVRGYTHALLAQRSGVSANEITDLEFGQDRNVPVGTVEMLAAGLGCAEHELLTLAVTSPKSREFHRRIGRAIRSKRLEQKVSQEEFAEKVGMHRAAYGSLERGEKDSQLSTLRRVADGLGIRLSYLIEKAEKADPASARVLPSRRAPGHTRGRAVRARP